jgi:hypothetical protein
LLEDFYGLKQYRLVPDDLFIVKYTATAAAVSKAGVPLVATQAESEELTNVPAVVPAVTPTAGAESGTLKLRANVKDEPQKRLLLVATRDEMEAAEKQGGGAQLPQSALAAHVDDSEFSFVITLNEGYEGGGTHFLYSEETVRPKAGSLLIFSGRNKHAALEVTAGVRYLMTGFVLYAGPKPTANQTT